MHGTLDCFCRFMTVQLYSEKKFFTKRKPSNGKKKIKQPYVLYIGPRCRVASLCLERPTVLGYLFWGHIFMVPMSKSVTNGRHGGWMHVSALLSKFCLLWSLSVSACLNSTPHYDNPLLHFDQNILQKLNNWEYEIIFHVLH